MKTRNVATALENYRLLKLSRILMFNQRAFGWLKRSIFGALILTAMLLPFFL